MKFSDGFCELITNRRITIHIHFSLFSLCTVASSACEDPDTDVVLFYKFVIHIFYGKFCCEMCYDLRVMCMILLA